MKAHNSWTLRPRITATLGVLLAFALVPLVAAATDVLDREVSFAIAPAPLATVLIEFSQQSGIQVAAADPDISRLHSDGVTGTHPIRDALQTLLQGTGLGFMSLGVNTLAIRPKSVISAATGNPAAASGQNAAASAAVPRGSPPDTTSSSAVLPSVTITVPKLPEPQQLAATAYPSSSPPTPNRLGIPNNLPAGTALFVRIRPGCHRQRMRSYRLGCGKWPRWSVRPLSRKYHAKLTSRSCSQPTRGN